jgi:hypothetical protein
MEQLVEFFTSLATPADDPRWKVWKSFYVSGTLDAEVSFNLDQINIMKIMEQYIPLPESYYQFQRKSKQNSQMMNMKFEKFSPRITQLVYKDSHGEIEGKGQYFLNKKLANFEKTMEDPNLKMVTDLFHNGFPIVPFPAIERCLGFGVTSGTAKIEKGQIKLAYDFELEQSHPDCLFNMAESKKEKEVRYME